MTGRDAIALLVILAGPYYVIILGACLYYALEEVALRWKGLPDAPPAARGGASAEQEEQ